MSVPEGFLPWAETARGIQLNNVAPEVIPGSGIGVVATRKIKIGETILRVPIRALRTIETVPKPIADALAGASVHGVLAAEMALEMAPERAPDLDLDSSNSGNSSSSSSSSEDFAVWRTVLPTRQDFEACLPLMWPRALQALLPRRAKDLLDKQLANFRKDCDVALRAFADCLARDDYLYAWLLVNTRTFYNRMAKMQAYPPEDRLVCMPVADLFNHADRGCQLAFSPEGYSVVADRPYDAAEEVFLSYGPHSNDFLLTEYGFVLASNRWDEVLLDEAILPKLTRAQREDLAAADFLGRYTLDAETLGCHRTQVALRRRCCTEEQWLAFLAGADDGAASQQAVDELLAAVLRDVLALSERTLRLVEAAEAGTRAQRELLARRWRQIGTLVRRALELLGEQ